MLKILNIHQKPDDLYTTTSVPENNVTTVPNPHPCVGCDTNNGWLIFCATIAIIMTIIGFILSIVLLRIKYKNCFQMKIICRKEKNTTEIEERVEGEEKFSRMRNRPLPPLPDYCFRDEDIGRNDHIYETIPEI